jgi:hypothetical protein
MRLLASLAILVIAFSPTGAAQSDADQCRSIEKSERWRGGFEFGHIDNRYGDPIVAREFKGVVSGEHDGQPMKSALVQIRGEGTKAKILTTRTDNSGRFRFRDLPAGLYFIVAVTEGFQSVSGCVVIDRRANRSESAILRLPLGV